MAGYSRESKRQNDALQSILRGENPEKRIFVAQNDGESKKRVKEEREGQQKGVIEKLEATKAARVPWFCPECKKVMKTQLDDKMWYLYDHCFDCQVKIETKMRIDGTYDDWVEKKINANKLAWVQEQKESLPPESVKAAIVFLTIGPIILLYLYLQRYFVKGIFVGSLKD